MIDFHAHILPNIDDGAKDIDQTFHLMQEAKKAGFDGVILTSHYLEGFYETDHLERKVWKEVLTQNTEIQKINLALYLANEIYFSENIFSLLEQGKVSTIHNSHYILFELPMKEKPFNLECELQNLKAKGIIPILAHPERYDFIQKNPNMVLELIEKGILMQCNFGSFIGQYGKKAQKTVNLLLEHHMIHFLGSDVHKPNTIYPRIQEIVKQLEEKIGIEELEKLTTKNAKLVLEDKQVEIQEPEEIIMNLTEKIKTYFGK